MSDDNVEQGVFTPEHQEECLEELDLGKALYIKVEKEGWDAKLTGMTEVRGKKRAPSLRDRIKEVEEERKRLAAETTEKVRLALWSLYDLKQYDNRISAEDTATLQDLFWRLDNNG